MKILYIGEPSTHDLYLAGGVPSHWFYGAVEMEQDGHEVVWAKERSALLNDLRIIHTHRPDMVFIPNLNLHNHLLILFLAAVGLYRKPIYAYLHHEPLVKNGIKSRFYKLMFRGIRHLFFLSELTLTETIKPGIVAKEKCSVPGWGADMDFYSKIDTSDNGWFVSTGKENRDFDTLIEAFRLSEARLHIMTANRHNGANYENLGEKCKDIPNIKVTILDNSSSNYTQMVREMASARALVCPLLPEKLNYCVGLSTIADAEGLGKPLIITANPYHDNRLSGDGTYRVSTVNDWIDAINAIQSSSNSRPTPGTTMAKAYMHMKKVMAL